MQSKFNKIFFLSGLLIFLLFATWGWIKLPYGFNFIDEGYHITESWRLTAGDELFKDKSSGAIALYILLNSQIFKIYPNITLLDFRKLQYFLTLLSLILLSIALYRASHVYWLLPIIFSLFAFTGLDPLGMMSNLNYYTYPHLFITLHVAFFTLGLYEENIFRKHFFYLLAGLSLWGISFSLIHLSLVAFAPITIFILSRKRKLFSFSLSFKDLCIIFTPFILCWIIFIVIYQDKFLIALFESAKYNIENHWTIKSANWEALKHISVSFFLLMGILLCLKKLASFASIIALASISLLTFFIIDTSFFHLISPYYDGWFSRPMWFDSFLIACMVLFWISFFRRYRKNHSFNKGKEICFILLVPATIQSISSSIVSTNGILNVLYVSFLLVPAFSYLFIYDADFKKRAAWIQLFIFIIVLAPYYYHTTYADWNFTYFDVPPKRATHTIQFGFGKGIKTNALYANLYDWIRQNARIFDYRKSFSISYITSPMIHMITKQRPSLDDSFVDFSSRTTSFLANEMKHMETKDRHPSIVFVFERMPCLLPVSIEKETFTWPRRQFDFQRSNDPISLYVKLNMIPVSEFRISEGNIVRCYIDPKKYEERFPRQKHLNSLDN